MSDAAASASDSNSAELLYEIRDHIGCVTFNRPTARNALTFAMYEGLAAICRSAGADGKVRALIVTGAGGTFAAGTDIAQFRAFETEADGLAYEKKMDDILSDIENCPVPTIAAIAGACTGGGAAIATACDLRLGTQDMRFGFPIARTLGNCLSVANLARLSALLGQGRTRELIFTARLVGAEEALRLGLVTEILSDVDALVDRADALAHRIADYAPLTLRVTKEMFRRLRNEGPAARDDDLIAMCYTSEDFHEGLDAFLTKRSPKWKGR